MPGKIKKTNGTFRVTTPGGVRSKGTTKAKAKAQVRLLAGIDHGLKPTKNRRSK